MNKFYRTVWNSAKGVWQVVGEIGSSKGKQKSMRLMRPVLIGAGSLILISTQALASDLPTNGTVVGGNASISTSGQNMTIHQSTNKVAIDWQSFSIGESNRVEFVQPSSSSVALNRVTGDQVSNIRGALKSNGQVFLVNPNGVLFSSNAQVDVGALVASTLDISTEEFMNGNFTFNGTSGNAIINQGNIVAADGGYVAMIAAKIENTGSITANAGSVQMAAGERVVLDMGGPVKLEIEQGALETLISNGGAIKADGGVIWLTSQAASDLATSLINNSGIIEANSLTSQGGQIVLLGDDITNSGALAANGVTGGGEVLIGGDWQGANADLYPHATNVTLTDTSLISANATENGEGGKVVIWSGLDKADGLTQVAGSIEALGADGQKGGNVETSGKNLSVADGAVIKAKTWLIDPINITVESTGSTTDLTSSSIKASFIESTLNGGTGVILQAGNDITINEAISWNESLFSLNAGNNIYINANMTATGDGSLAFEYGQASADGGSSLYTVADGIDILIPKASAFTWKKGSSGEITNLVFDNSNLRFGDGGQASINDMGSLLQPFYYDNVTPGRDGWYKLTFSNYPLDFAIGLGGESSDSWNNEGIILSTNGGSSLQSAVTALSINISKYFEKTGTLTASMSLDNGIEIRNDYTLDAGDYYLKAVTTVTNTTDSDLTNIRLWVGTRDDYVGPRDSNYKTKGNIGSGGFEAIVANSEQSKAIIISEDTFESGNGAAVLFYSTTEGADTVINICCSFANVFNTDPRDSVIRTPSAEDGSYGLFMNIGNLLSAQAGGVTWYYAAAPVSLLSQVVNQVGESAGVSIKTNNSSALSTPSTSITNEKPLQNAIASVFSSTNINLESSLSLNSTIVPSTLINPALTPVSGTSFGDAVVGIGGLSGGLAFISVDSNSTGKSANTSGSSTGSEMGGVDPSGFMKVLVVGGGVNVDGQSTQNGNSDEDQPISETIN